MISKQYFEETFSLATAQALQTWANENLITPTLGDYAMSINYAVNGGDLLMYAETELTGLTENDTYTVRMYINNITSNAFRIFINALPNDNSSAILQEGWISTPAWKEFSFVATATTMYLAIGDDSPAPAVTTSTVDNVTVKDSGGTNYVINSTFEGNDTTGWYGQSINTELAIYQYAVEPTPPGDNPYLEPVNIPAYVDTGDDTDGLITVANGRMGSAYLNRADISNFYVEPGDYSSIGHINVTTSGTASKRRTVSLHNGNDTHPGKLTDGERAFYSLNLHGASYWTIDRPSWATNGQRAYTFEDGSTYNILNRSYSRETGNVVFVSNLSNYNTIQQCRFEEMTEANRINDIMGILLQHNTNGYSVDYVEIEGTKIIANEAVNQNDFIHIARNWSSTVPENRQRGSMPNTVIDGNKIYMTNVPYVEDAIDVKIGSDDPSKPITVTNNIMWGYQYYGENSALIFHMNPYNVIYENNTHYDCRVGFSCGASGSDVDGESLRLGMVDSVVQNNLFYECGIDGYFAIKQNSTRTTQFNNNAIINGTHGFLSAGYNGEFCEFSSNEVCNTPNLWDDIGGNNSGYVATVNATTSHFATAVDGGYTEDFVFTKDEFTNNPTVVTLTNAVKP